MIRKRIKLAPEKAIFIFVDEVLPPTAQLMSAIYEEHKYVFLPLHAAGFSASPAIYRLLTHSPSGMKMVSCMSATPARIRSDPGELAVLAGTMDIYRIV